MRVNERCLNISGSSSARAAAVSAQQQQHYVCRRRRRSNAVVVLSAKQHEAAETSSDTTTTSSSSSNARAVAMTAAITAAAITAAAAAAPRAAHAASADAAWKPRRHHRHIGERFTDTWADAVVEAQEAERERVRDLQRQLTAARARADEEAAKRQAAEARARSAELKLTARAAYDPDAALSVRVFGADVTGPMTFALLVAAGYQAWATDLYGRLTGRRRGGRRGRWVYDRSLGGRKVWVPAAADEGDEGAGAGYAAGGVALSADDFEALAAAAAARAGATGQASSSLSAAAAAPAADYEPPSWWDRPGVLPPASEADRAARVAAAERILRRIESAKNRGEDYDLSDILALRSACMSAGGATLEARTVGARDAIFRAAVDAGVRACLEPGSVDLGGYPPLRLIAGVAADVGFPEQRGVSVVRGAVAGAGRGRVVEAIAALEKSDDGGALLALSQLAALLAGMPVLIDEDEGRGAPCPEVGLVADELNGWAPVAAREKLLLLAVQVDEASAPLVAQLLGLSPEDALPRVRRALAAQSGGGDGGAGGAGSGGTAAGADSDDS